MRKIVYVALLLLAVAGAIGSPVIEAAAGSACSNLPAGCSCRCECGQLLKCCDSVCKPVYDPNLLCPQIACL